MWSRSRKGRYGEVVPTSKESKLFSLPLSCHERITLIESGHAAGTGGVGKLSRRSGTPNIVPCFFFFSREITFVESGQAAGRGGVGKFSLRPGTPNFVPCFFVLPRE